MHCPRCGQEQATGNLKFCSKCGLPLDLVFELINNEGTLPELQAKTRWFSRGTGLKVALMWFLFWEMLVVPMLAILDGDEIVAIAAVFGFVGAVIIAAISIMFLDGAPKKRVYVDPTHGQQAIPGNIGQASGVLPAGQQQNAQDFVAPSASNWKAPDTGDLVTPGSVTEGTTRLLKKDEEA